MKKSIFLTQIAGYNIQLIRQNRYLFTVEYGQQIDKDLDYAQAAAKLGQAIMHACTCEGRMDL